MLSLLTEHFRLFAVCPRPSELTETELGHFPFRSALFLTGNNCRIVDGRTFWVSSYKRGPAFIFHINFLMFCLASVLRVVRRMVNVPNNGRVHPRRWPTVKRSHGRNKAFSPVPNCTTRNSKFARALRQIPFS